MIYNISRWVSFSEKLSFDLIHDIKNLFQVLPRFSQKYLIVNVLHISLLTFLISWNKCNENLLNKELFIGTLIVVLHIWPYPRKILWYIFLSSHNFWWENTLFSVILPSSLLPSTFILFFLYFLFVVLGFELRTLCLLEQHSTTWAMSLLVLLPFLFLTSLLYCFII
jgi:hypothetical protein